MKHEHGLWGAVKCWLSPCAVARELQWRRDREMAKRRVEAFMVQDRLDTERIREWMRRDDGEEW